MSQSIAFQGRSLLFNIIFVLINLAGLAFIVAGFHKNFEQFKWELVATGALLIAVSAAGIFIFRGRWIMAGVSRILVGGLCIVSGLIKANDPIGFGYKLEEYFEDGALAYRIKEWFGIPSFSLEFLMDYALPISIVICLAEIIFGVLLIIGGRIKLLSYLVLSMLLFFTFLTWHTATCNPDKKFVDRDTYEMSDHMALMKIEESKTNKDVKIVEKTEDYLVVDEKKSPQCVTDCGCFGDAMKGSVGRSLTPDESLWKDLILVYLTIWIFIAQWIIQPNTTRQNIYFTVFSLVVVSFFSWVFGWYFPILFALMVIVGALWMVRAGGKILGNYAGASLVVTVISMLFVTYVLLYEPVKDYRPYAVGSNLMQKMHDGVEGKYESMLVYKNRKTGAVREYSSTSQAYINSKIWENKNWVYKSMVQKTIIETKLPSIADFEPYIPIGEVGKDELQLDYVRTIINSTTIKGLKIYDKASKTTMDLPMEEYNEIDYPADNYEVRDTIAMTRQDVTDINIRDYILTSKQILIVSSRNIRDANWSDIDKLRSIYGQCRRHKILFIMICTSNRKDIDAFRNKYNFHVPVFINDEKTLQAVSRSNPALLVIEKAVVKGKYPHRELPTFDWLNETILHKK